MQKHFHNGNVHHSTYRTLAIAITSLTLLWNIKLISCDEPSFECLAAHAKSKGLNEPEFDRVIYDSQRKECTIAIKKFSDKIRNDIIEKMADVTSDRKQSECIRGKFINDDTFVNNIIKGEALAAIDGKEKSDKLSGVESFAEEFITSAISSCLVAHREE